MTDTAWRKPSSIENAIVEHLLAPDFPGKDELVRQFADSLVSLIDDDGSIKFKVGGSRAAEVRPRVPTEGEFEDSDGITVYVLLHVIDGYIHELEVYKENATRIQDWSAVSSMRVFVMTQK